MSAVVVIGGGAVGLATALALRDAGEPVRLIERAVGGENASFGNAGVISPYSVAPLSTPGLWRKMPRWLLDPSGPVFLRPRHAPRFLPWAARFVAHGREAVVRRAAEAMHALNHDNVALYRRLLAGTGHEHLIRDAAYVLATRRPAAARLDDLENGLRRAYGAELERVEGAALRRLEPALSPDFRAAVVVHGQARALSPGRINAALRDRLRAEGGEITEAEVQALRPEAGGWRIETGAGSFHAARVAVTAGVWSAKLLAPLGLRLPLEAERGYHATFRDPGVCLNNSVMDADRKFVASSMEEGLRAAGTAEFAGLDAAPDPRRAEAIARAARAMLPDLRPEPRSDWSGQRPSFPDSLPAIGPVPGRPGLFAGFGHAHWGFMMAPKTGRLLADLVLGRPANIDLSPYRLDRFA